MFTAAARIAVAVTSLCISNLSQQSVSREQLKDDEVPIRVTITHKKGEVEIHFALIHDHPKSRYGGDIHAHMLLDFDHPTAGRIRTGIETRDETDGDDKKLTTGYIRMSPETAKHCRVEIYVGLIRFHSLIEHRYTIPLEIIADELKPKQRDSN